MSTVSMRAAKSTLSRLVETIESGRKREIVITRNGKAAARLVAMHVTSTEKRLGIAEGKFEVPDSIDQCHDEAARLFWGHMS